MEPRHGLEQRSELVAAAFVEQQSKLVEGIGRDLLKCVGGHSVLQSTGCPWFLRSPRNPTTCLEDTRLRHRRAEHRVDLTGRAGGLCWREAKRPGERDGVIVRSATAR